MLLLNFKFESPKRNRARDLFCFMCFTGLRVSDLKKYVKISEDFKKLEMERTWDNIPMLKINPKTSD
jgi:hypothetical protein